MTALTGRSFYRITCMCFFERCFLIVVAGNTKGNLLIIKKIGFIRAMGKVKGVASFFL